MASRHVYVTQYGIIWRFTRRNYIRYLRDIAAGKGVSLDDYGPSLDGPVVRVLDLDESGAEELLRAEGEQA